MKVEPLESSKRILTLESELKRVLIEKKSFNQFTIKINTHSRVFCCYVVVVP